MSIYLLPKTVIKEMDKVRRTFFWQGGHSRRKYHLVRRTKICKSNKKGGLGIKDIRKMNSASGGENLSKILDFGRI